MTGRELRQQLVAQLRKSKALKSELVARAFLAVPRERFVPEHAKGKGLAEIYKDVALITKKDSRGVPISSSSQPGNHGHDARGTTSGPRSQSA